MYRIIGADGNQYGPIAAEQLRQWIAEGRVNAQTQVQLEGSTEWKALTSYPELAAFVAPAPLPYAAPLPSRETAAQQVHGPAIGLLVTAILGLIVALAGLVLNALGVTFGAGQAPAGSEMEQVVNYFAGGLGIIQSVIQLATGTVVLLGALKMLKLENYRLAFASAILALLPCISPCCLLGLPFGIWALVILNRPEVKSMFQS